MMDGSGGAAGGFDSGYVPTNYTLSNGNRDVSSTASAAANCVVSASSHSTGKYYFEIVRGPNNFIVAGLHNKAPASAIHEQPGQNAQSWGIFFNNGQMYHNGSVSGTYGSGSNTDGAVFGFAIDFDNAKLFMSLNNSWQGSGDPVAGTNPAWTDISGTCRIALNCYFGSPVTASCNFTSSQFTYSPPSGYSAWD